ncbi:MAG: hypothetical protein AAF502_03545 [Bacteroidota bacterium]
MKAFSVVNRDFLILTKTFLQKLEGNFKFGGLETKLFDPSEQENFYSLVVRFFVPPKFKQMDLQFNFIDDLFEGGNRFFILQIYYGISDEVPKEAMPEINELCKLINSRVPLGQFGQMEEISNAYFKHNIILDFTYDENHNVEIVETSTKMILNILENFRLTFSQVLEGKQTAVEALKESKFAYMWFS